jgi:crotonobetaine/carnitine-CoA ligase
MRPVTGPELLARAASGRGTEVYLHTTTGAITLRELADHVTRATGRLRSLGVRRGDRVAVMLPNDIGHVVLILALLTVRAVWVPVNPRVIGAPLSGLLGRSDPSMLLVDRECVPAVTASGSAADLRTVVREAAGGPDGSSDWLGLDDSTTTPGDPVVDADPDDVVAIMFTSGTTGPPKGVQVTDRMLVTAAGSAVLVSGAVDGDVLFLWEPLCHVGGAQMLLVPLLIEVRLAMVPAFSVSRFWTDVAAAGATHIHHLGGILSMLLSAPPHPAERAHRVRCSWGGGITPAVWRAAEARFGLQVRECYGLTEASSICTANRLGPEHGVGRAVPPFEVAVLDPDGAPVAEGALGEIAVRSGERGVLTPGYFRDPAATATAWRDGWWRTGDLGRPVGADVHYAGRLGQSIRHHGENVSAWEVESVVNTHPRVEESALVGRLAATGEQDLALYVTAAAGAIVDPVELIEWCREQLPSYQVPTTVAIVAAFPRTPSQRIDKAGL